MAARHPSGPTRTRAPALLPGRVHVSFQPSGVTPSGSALLPIAPTGRRGRPSTLRAPDWRIRGRGAHNILSVLEPRGYVSYDKCSLQDNRPFEAERGQ